MCLKMVNPVVFSRSFAVLIKIKMLFACSLIGFNRWSSLTFDTVKNRTHNGNLLINLSGSKHPKDTTTPTSNCPSTLSGGQVWTGRWLCWANRCTGTLFDRVTTSSLFTIPSLSFLQTENKRETSCTNSCALKKTLLSKTVIFNWLNVRKCLQKTCIMEFPEDTPAGREKFQWFHSKVIRTKEQQPPGRSRGGAHASPPQGLQTALLEEPQRRYCCLALRQHHDTPPFKVIFVIAVSVHNCNLSFKKNKKNLSKLFSESSRMW